MLRIDAEQIAARGFSYATVDGEGRRQVVALDPASLQGFYELTAEHHAIKADFAEPLRVVDLRIPAGPLQASLRSSATVGPGSVELRIPREPEARVVADTGPPESAVEVVGGGVRPGGVSGHCAVGSIEFACGRLEHPDWFAPIELKDLRARDLVLRLDDGGVRLQVGALEVGELSLRFGELTLRARKVCLPAGLRWHESGLELAELRCEAIELHADLGDRAGQRDEVPVVPPFEEPEEEPEAMGARAADAPPAAKGDRAEGNRAEGNREERVGASQEGLTSVEEVGEPLIGPDASATAASDDAGAQCSDEPPPAQEPDRSKAVRSSTLDLEFLDQLDGHVHIDLTVDIKLPIIGGRVATHRFRVPVERGLVNFKVIEQGLSRLEDAFVDFVVKGDRLVLQRDVPVLPIEPKVLVFWELAPEEQADADHDLVALRRLLKWNLAMEPEESSGASSVALRRLQMEPIDIVLGLLGESTLQIADGQVVQLGRPAEGASEAAGGVERLEVQGTLRYLPGEDVEETELTLLVGGVDVAVDRIKAGQGVLHAGRVRVAGTSRIGLGFLGFEPRSIAGTIEGIEARELRWNPWVPATPGARS